jgi:hypothetical protein
MKKVNAKQLLAVGVIGLALASCGGGGGGGGSSQTQTQISANPIAMNIYAGSRILSSATVPLNIPVIVVYINGQPVRLLFDTGASGVLVNQGTFPIPQSAYTSQTFYGQFGDGTVFSGTVANVQVCLTSASTDCINMPVAVNSETSGTNAAFPTGDYIVGDFGMDCGQNTFASFDNTNIIVNTFCPLYYLWQQNQYFNAYSFTFYQPSNGYYGMPSINTPIGSITLGNFSPSNLISYSTDPSLPINVAFTNAYYTNSYTGPIIFDTGTQDIALSGSVLQAEIPNFNPSSDENNCGITNWLQGGYQISYSIPYANNSSMFTTSFITEPPSNMCSTLATLFTNQHSLLIEGFTMDVSSVLHRSALIGLAGMFNHNFIWLLGSNGMVQYISIQ